MSLPLTVLIPCKDERLNIRPCIESAMTIADEVLVADSGSTDGTLEIVRSLGCRVIEREYRTSGDFKNWAIPQASHEWVLLIDADERVPEKLAGEIKQLLRTEPKHDGYWIYRDNHFMGHRVYHCGWNHDKVLRLFRRDQAQYEGPSDHGEVQIASGNVGFLKEHFLHYTYWDYDQLFRKFHRYTTLQARQWHDQGKPASSVRMFVNPFYRFFKSYVLQLGFLDGRIGLQISLMAGFYSFTKQARLWALHHAQQQPDPEAALAATRDADADVRRAA
ncbi:MAG: glycosyltransferase family 2 protein [Pirellulaceae bacterium]|nr:glycosyltransferase family 2 protein [Planctomycetales bacterium]